MEPKHADASWSDGVSRHFQPLFLALACVLQLPEGVSIANARAS